MKTVNTINFGIQRKIVANMTAESWETIPHVTYNYEPDVTDFMKEYKKLKPYLIIWSMQTHNKRGCFYSPARVSATRKLPPG